MTARRIMVQGTMSNSGKSFLTAGLCRIFHQDGWRTAPFKSQNMALNSFITEDGLEIGRAQAVQAEAAGIEPSVDMNPILLKPTGHMGSQVVVRGEVAGNWKAMDYYRDKPRFLPYIRESWANLERAFDAIVIEGAGSPAEINLKDHDFVNMGLARMVDAPVLLVGDIDRGGVFASLYGTVKLLDGEEQAMIKGIVINKFRGDLSLLEPGLRMIEEKVGIPVLGVVPMEDIDLEDEDSLAPRLEGRRRRPGPVVDMAVIRFPHLSNFTDFQVFERMEGVQVRYVSRPEQLGRPDLLFLPGTKNTMADLQWARDRGMEEAVLRLVSEGGKAVGICGGFQMMGRRLSDPLGVEQEGSMEGMGLLDAETEFQAVKTRTRATGRWADAPAWLGDSLRSGCPVSGYEIHMGLTQNLGGCSECIRLEDGRSGGLADRGGNVWGSYLHGLFDTPGLAEALVRSLAAEKGLEAPRGIEDGAAYRQEQYDRLAGLLRRSLDLEAVYRILEGSGRKEEGVL